MRYKMKCSVGHYPKGVQIPKNVLALRVVADSLVAGGVCAGRGARERGELRSTELPAIHSTVQSRGTTNLDRRERERERDRHRYKAADWLKAG